MSETDYIRNDVTHLFDEYANYRTFDDMDECWAFTTGELTYQPSRDGFVREHQVPFYKELLSKIKEKCFMRDGYYCIQADTLIELLEDF